ncbi:hypothetical protein EF294_15290 [Gordonia oryzae]|uniref:Uncharacterized protein n=1 Tax=Gordonia oryzae TaxID=2487349 RepID=A0A3N4G6X3_9ACTN|nr:hypothetical protein [Gordonia oryzae]RPA58532.1 hypothetical protein EF294_15290 [Gordonia oryzae]
MIEQSHTALRVIDAALTEPVRQRVSTLGAHVAAVVDLDAAGAVIVVAQTVDDQILLAAPPLHDITPRALDRALADYLVAVGRVNRPTDDEWRDELRTLAGRARTRLASSGGAFIMGERQVRLFRVTRRDLEVATAALVADLAAHLDAVLAQTGSTTVPVVLTTTHTQWPGLPTMLADARRTPVIVVDDEASLHTPAHGVTPTPSGDFPTPGRISGDVVSVVEPAPPATAPPATAPPAAEMPAPRSPVEQSRPEVADAVTEEILTVTDKLPVLHGDDHPLRDDHPHHDDHPLRDDPRHEDSRYDHGVLVGSELRATDRRWYSRPRWLLGGAVAGVLLVFGAAMAVSSVGSTAPAPPAVAVSTITDQAAATSSTSPPQFADPSDLVQARQPAVVYTTPPPPPVQTNSRTPNNRPRRARPRPAPRLSIPIPGRPPIVIP